MQRLNFVCRLACFMLDSSAAAFAVVALRWRPVSGLPRWALDRPQNTSAVAHELNQLNSSTADGCADIRLLPQCLFFRRWLLAP